MFIAAAVGLTFLIFSIVFYTIFMKDNHSKTHFQKFAVLTLGNTLYMTLFGVLLNLGQDLPAINIINRATLIASMFVVLFFFMLLNSMFNLKQHKVIIVFYSIATLFTVVLCINHPLVLQAQLEQTSSYYMALQRGIIHKIWGGFMLFLLVYSAVWLYVTYMRIPRSQAKYRASVLILMIFSIGWVISGGLDALTSMRILDLPPVSWIGSLSIVITAAILLLNSYENLDNTVNRLYDELIHDALTGAFSKSYFDIELNKLLARLRREESRHYIIVFDIDDFKKINDIYGHVCGDFILREMIRTVRKQLRPSDILARFGGDEFLLLVEFSPPDMDIHAMMKRIMDSIRNRDFVFNGKTIQVACSFGGAYLDKEVVSDLMSTEDVLVLADNALYEAKRAGKDRFILKTDELKIN